MDAVNSCHSAELSAAQAATAHRQLAAYFQRFQPRLAPGNCRHIQMLLRVAQARGAGGVQAVCSRGTQVGTPPARARDGPVHPPTSACRPNALQVLTQAASGATRLAAPAADAGLVDGGSSSAGGAVLTVNSFLVLTGLDNLNLFKLVRWAAAVCRSCRMALLVADGPVLPAVSVPGLCAHVRMLTPPLPC